VFAEVPLNNPDLGWYGKADLLSVKAATNATAGEGQAAECAITDFKTGAQKGDHALQLRIYALLWARDSTLNPTGRHATQLTLIYPTETVAVAPPTTEEEMNALAAELATRTAAARATVAMSPPEARPSDEACEWCDVKHMCEAYWSSMAGEVPSSPEPQSSVCDVEVLISSRRSPGSWMGHIAAVPVLGSSLRVGAQILIRARPGDPHFAGVLSAGRRVRLLSAQQLPASEESNGMVAIALTRSSEVFILE
jgi:hypothetical protein